MLSDELAISENEYLAHTRFNSFYLSDHCYRLLPPHLAIKFTKDFDKHCIKIFEMNFEYAHTAAVSLLPMPNGPVSEEREDPTQQPEQSKFLFATRFDCFSNTRPWCSQVEGSQSDAVWSLARSSSASSSISGGLTRAPSRQMSWEVYSLWIDLTEEGKLFPSSGLLARIFPDRVNKKANDAIIMKPAEGESA